MDFAGAGDAILAVTEGFAEDDADSGDGHFMLLPLISRGAADNVVSSMESIIHI